MALLQARPGRVKQNIAGDQRDTERCQCAVIMMDIRGDLSGIAAAGTANDRTNDRCKLLNITYTPAAYPVELMTLSNEKGVRPGQRLPNWPDTLQNKILGPERYRGGVVSMIFKYCDDNKLPLLDERLY